ncbi:DNA-directed RNA polymerase subunit alpha [Candidatus Wolfebacteria bacterium]|nr:DNA-directed RNA polymerase subunit alpha [Candidatus Wolfebacteria bacterium]
MADYTIQLPSKPGVVSEEGFLGVYQIDGLYPGYGHTLGNSLRRIILSSLPGAAITSVKIAGANHEFSTLEGVREDVIGIILNLKQIRIKLHGDEPQTLSLKVTGPKDVIAKDIEAPSQAEILNPEQPVVTITGKVTLDIEMTVEKGLGYMPKEMLQKEKVEAGTITLDAAFTPVRRANYEVESMRVGDRTDFNRLKLFIETDGTVTPREVLEHSITTMIRQLKAVVEFKDEESEGAETLKEGLDEHKAESEAIAEEQAEDRKEFLKTRIESLGLSTRTENALVNANIRTVGGLVRKKEDDLLSLEGLGDKGLQEIKRILGNYGIILK